MGRRCWRLPRALQRKATRYVEWLLARLICDATSENCPAIITPRLDRSRSEIHAIIGVAVVDIMRLCTTRSTAYLHITRPAAYSCIRPRTNNEGQDNRTYTNSNQPTRLDIPLA